MSKHEQLIMDVYTTREASKLAKQARNAKRKEVGDCIRWDHGHGMTCDATESIGEMCGMCETCAKVRPIALDYWAKANKAGAALRAVIFEGKRLAKEEDPK